MATDLEQFEAIRARWQKVQARREKHEWQLFDRYRDRRPPRSWQTRTELKRAETISAAESRVMDQMFALLDDIGGRYWRAGAPCHWIMEELTYADAITTDPLSVIPPIPYGYSARDTECFAGAVAA